MGVARISGLLSWSSRSLTSPPAPPAGRQPIKRDDLLGGELMLGEVRRGTERHGSHWWNRLASGVEIDLTRSQFVDGQEVVAARPVTRPAGPPRRRGEEYRLLRERVAAHLGPLPPEV